MICACINGALRTTTRLTVVALITRCGPMLRTTQVKEASLPLMTVMFSIVDPKLGAGMLLLLLLWWCWPSIPVKHMFERHYNFPALHIYKTLERLDSIFPCTSGFFKSLLCLASWATAGYWISQLKKTVLSCKTTTTSAMIFSLLEKKSNGVMGFGREKSGMLVVDMKSCRAIMSKGWGKLFAIDVAFVSISWWILREGGGTGGRHTIIDERMR